jgi:hypothetical protein
MRSADLSNARSCADSFPTTQICRNATMPNKFDLSGFRKLPNELKLLILKYHTTWLNDRPECRLLQDCRNATRITSALTAFTHVCL